MNENNKLIFILWYEGNTQDDWHIIGTYYSTFEADAAIEYCKQYEKDNGKFFINRVVLSSGCVQFT